MRISTIIVLLFLSLTAYSATPVDFTEPSIDVLILKPSDIDYPDKNKIDNIREVVSKVQTYYQNQMSKHGFEPKTFKTNDVVVSEGNHPSSYYINSKRISGDMWADHFNYIARGNNIIYLIFVLGSDQIETGAVLRSVNWYDRNGNVTGKVSLCMIPAEAEYVLEVATGHELGHAFLDSSVHHKDEHNLMYNGKCFDCGKIDIEKQTLDYDQVAKIANNPYFHHTIESYLNADVNRDGFIDLHDVMIVRSAITSTSSYDTDVNEDGITDEVDLLVVKAKALEAIAAAAPVKFRLLPTTWGNTKR